MRHVVIFLLESLQQWLNVLLRQKLVYTVTMVRSTSQVTRARNYIENALLLNTHVVLLAVY